MHAQPSRQDTMLAFNISATTDTSMVDTKYGISHLVHKTCLFFKETWRYVQPFL